MSQILALDWGRKKIGYATSDSMGIAITPRTKIYRAKNIKEIWKMQAEDRKELEKIIQKYESEEIILGLPLNADGTESEASLGARQLAQELENEFSLPVKLVNEVLSSWDSRQAEDIDAQAAATLIQDYFEQKKRLEKGSASILLVVVIAIACFVLGAVFHYQSYMSEKVLHVSDQSELLIEIDDGDTLYKVAQSFSNYGIEFNKWYLRLWLKLNGANKPLRKGEFAMQDGWSREEILNQLINGSPHVRFFTHKEGNNIWELSDALKDKLPKYDEKEFWQAVRNVAQLKTIIGIDYPENTPSVEGFLFPETYSFEKGDSVSKVIESMLKHFRDRALPLLQKHPWSQEANGVYKLVTLASVIEKESGNFAEQGIISSVFWNRIHKNMRLQSDPTTIYGLLPNFNGNLTRAHLNAMSPYNTYQIKGLPLGPISNPGESALKAVVNPENTNYLYFVSMGNGEHVFSETYEQHNRYVQEYQLKRRSN